jgi:hypothetical protein
MGKIDITEKIHEFAATLQKNENIDNWHRWVAYLLETCEVVLDDLSAPESLRNMFLEQVESDIRERLQKGEW